MRVFACSIWLVGMIGCASKPPVVYPPLNEDEYRPFAEPGTATITGSSFLITRGGDIKKGAARQVFLIPETSFVTGRLDPKDNYYATFDWLGFSGTEPGTIAKAWRHTRIVVADVEGKFTFTKVPAGKYIVETKLFWQYMSCGFFGCGLTDTGAVLRSSIEVASGTSQEVQLTSSINR